MASYNEKEILSLESPLSAHQHAMEKTDYSDFLSTKEVISQVLKNRHPDNKTATSIIWDSKSGEAIAECLKNIGLSRLSGNINHGKNALVFESNNHQIVRLVHKDIEKNTRVCSPFVLQPIITKNIDDYRIEVLPKVHTLYEVLCSRKLAAYYGINKDSGMEPIVSQLHSDLRRCGLAFIENEIISPNIAIVKGVDGKPVALVLDPGAVRSRLIERMPFIKKDEKLMTYYEAAQRAHLESLGLKKGEIKGVFNDAQLEAALQKFISERGEGADKALYPAALKAGVSPSEFGAAAKDAAQGNPKQGFCHRIREQLTNRHNVALGGKS